MLHWEFYKLEKEFGTLQFEIEQDTGDGYFVFSAHENITVNLLLDMEGRDLWSADGIWYRKVSINHNGGETMNRKCCKFSFQIQTE